MQRPEPHLRATGAWTPRTVVRLPLGVGHGRAAGALEVRPNRSRRPRVAAVEREALTRGAQTVAVHLACRASVDSAHAHYGLRATSDQNTHAHAYLRLRRGEVAGVHVIAGGQVAVEVAVRHRIDRRRGDAAALHA